MGCADAISDLRILNLADSPRLAGTLDAFVDDRWGYAKRYEICHVTLLHLHPTLRWHGYGVSWLRASPMS